MGFQLPSIAFCPEMGLGDVSASQEVLLGWGECMGEPQELSADVVRGERQGLCRARSTPEGLTR